MILFFTEKSSYYYSVFSFFNWWKYVKRENISSLWFLLFFLFPYWRKWREISSVIVSDRRNKAGKSIVYCHWKGKLCNSFCDHYPTGEKHILVHSLLSISLLKETPWIPSFSIVSQKQIEKNTFSSLKKKKASLFLTSFFLFIEGNPVCDCSDAWKKNISDCIVFHLFFLDGESWEKTSGIIMIRWGNISSLPLFLEENSVEVFASKCHMWNK